jgi:hypothetical protein
MSDQMPLFACDEYVTPLSRVQPRRVLLHARLVHHLSLWVRVCLSAVKLTESRRIGVGCRASCEHCCGGANAGLGAHRCTTSATGLTLCRWCCRALARSCSGGSAVVSWQTMTCPQQYNAAIRDIALMAGTCAAGSPPAGTRLRSTGRIDQLCSLIRCRTWHGLRIKVTYNIEPATRAVLGALMAAVRRRLTPESAWC